MSVKTTGAEFRAFLMDKSIWKEGAYHDYTLLEIDGEEVEDFDVDELQDSSVIKILSGTIYKSEDDPCGKSFESVFRKWVRAQDKAYLVIEIDTGKVDDLVRSAKELGGRLVVRK